MLPPHPVPSTVPSAQGGYDPPLPLSWAAPDPGPVGSAPLLWLGPVWAQAPLELGGPTEPMRRRSTYSRLSDEL